MLQPDDQWVLTLALNPIFTWSTAAMAEFFRSDELFNSSTFQKAICQRIVHDLSDLAQRVSRRDAALKIDIAEQRPARLVRAPHDPLRQHPAGDESCSSFGVEA